MIDHMVDSYVNDDEVSGLRVNARFGSSGVTYSVHRPRTGTGTVGISVPKVFEILPGKRFLDCTSHGVLVY